MSSRARRRASLAWDFASVSDFSRSIDLVRVMAFPPEGPAQESETGLGFTPVTYHFKQENSICKVWLTRRDATHSVSSLKEEHASCKFLSCGRISWTCSWRVNLASRSPFEAN